MSKAVVFNLGCKVNQYECDVLAAELTKRGYDVSEELGYADIYIINTCAVTAEAERKSRQIISRCLKHNSDARIMVIGCASEKNKDFYVAEGVHYVGGVADKNKIIDNLDSVGIIDNSRPDKYEEFDSSPMVTRTRAYVKIQDGCDNFCSYCIIPYLRGRSRSRDINAAVREIEDLATKTSEIVITGINLSKYGTEYGTSLTELITKISHVPARIRLGSFYVEGIDEGLLGALKNLKEFCPHFHLSLQNGDAKVLKDMGRRYTPEDYLEKVALIRRYFPHAAITTDIIVGYPTEGEENFANTLDFVRKARFSDIHIFPFSAREGTRAALLPSVPPEIVKVRKAKLQAVRDEMKDEYLDEMIGVPQKTLFEEEHDGYFVGHSEYYVRIYVQSSIKYGIIVAKEKFRDGLLGEVYGN